MQPDTRLFRVGLTVMVGLVLFATIILLVGERTFLFSRKNIYFTRFLTVGGLTAGNPVQLNGVNVGKVERVVLPEDMGENLLEVWISVERRYAQRVRQDSLARIKTLGLLGDKYVEITSGSPTHPEIPPGEEIPAAPPTDVDELIATGEDVVEEIVATAHSMSNILARMDRGEGLLGELLSEREGGESVTAALGDTLESIQQVARKIEGGKGPIGRLISDEELGDRTAAAVGRLESILAKMEEGEGLLPGLLNDPTAKERFDTTLTNLNAAIADLAVVAEELKEGEGLVPRLLNDEEYGAEVSRELQELLSRLNLAADKLTTGDGTAARLMNDPSVYEAMNDILVGIDESRMLRWLVRNRQKAGIEKRYTEEMALEEESGEPDGL